MNIKLRKQFSKNYQVYEIELDGVPQDKIDDANAWLDELGEKGLNSMVEVVGVAENKPSYSKPKYSGVSSDVATPKQIEWLNKKGIDYNPNTITKAEATELLNAVFDHDKAKGTGSYSKPNKGITSITREDIATDDGLPF